MPVTASSSLRIRGLNFSAPDLDRVVEMERLSHEYNGPGDAFTWGKDQYRRLLRPRGSSNVRDGGALIATRGSETLGILCFKSAKNNEVEIIHLLISPSWRRQGIGAKLVDMFTDSAVFKRGHVATIVIPETMLDIQLLFKSRGFRCRKSIRRQFGEHDGYLMLKSSKSLPPEPEEDET